MKKELLVGLSEEQIAKLKACKSQEEILKVAKDEGVELSDEQLEAVSGGCGGEEGLVCPHCGRSDYRTQTGGNGYTVYYCQGCYNMFYRNDKTGAVTKTMY